MHDRRTSVVCAALLLIAAAAPAFAQTKPAKPPVPTTPATQRMDLNGQWQANFTVNNSLNQFQLEKVMIQHLGDHVIATKITGDEWVPAGKVTVKGDYSSNPFTAEQVCADKGYNNPNWYKITVTVLDARHFKVEGGCSGNVTWERVGKITLALDSAILFDLDKSVLKPDAQQTLSQIVSYLAEKHPKSHLLVAGYTDDTGTDAHNLTLSQRRAQSVAAWLSQHQVAQARLKTEGFGKKDPRYPNTNEEARAHNRRVEIVILD